MSSAGEDRPIMLEHLHPSKSPAEIRLNKELKELNLGCPSSIINARRVDRLVIEVRICASDGPLANLPLNFTCTYNEEYPLEAPRIYLTEPRPIKIANDNETHGLFHPNIDWESGGVCLNILRLGWNPCLGVEAICFGLLILVEEPTEDDPLNREAGELISRDPAAFAAKARQSYHDLLAHQ